MSQALHGNVLFLQMFKKVPFCEGRHKQALSKKSTWSGCCASLPCSWFYVGSLIYKTYTCWKIDMNDWSKSPTHNYSNLFSVHFPIKTSSEILALQTLFKYFSAPSLGNLIAHISDWIHPTAHWCPVNIFKCSYFI